MILFSKFIFRLKQEIIEIILFLSGLRLFILPAMLI